MASWKCYSVPVLAGLVVALAAGCQKTERKPAVRLAHIYEPLAGPAHAACYKWLQDVAAQFEESHPDLSIQFEQVKWDKIDAKSMSDFRAGIPHDLVMSSPQLMPQHFEVGDLLDLGPLLKSWPREKIDDFAWTPSWRKCGRGEARLGIPTGAHARVVIYRKDLFRAAGLDVENPPGDLATLLDAATTLTRDTDGDGDIDVWGLGLYLGPSRATIELYFAPLLWHFGGDLYDPQTREAIFAGEAGVRAVEWLRDCVKKRRVTPPGALGEKYDDIIFEEFRRGHLAMAWGWGSYWNQALEDDGWTSGLYPPTRDGRSDKVGIFVTPTREGAQFTNCWAVSIHQLSERSRDALALMDVMLEPNNLEAYVDGLPARRSIWAKPEYQTPWYQTWQRAIAAGRPMPDTPHYNDLADKVQSAIQEIILSDADPRATLQRYQDEFNARYAKP